MYKVRLNRSLSGWLLIALDEESRELVDQYYGDLVKPSERADDGPLAEVLAFVMLRLRCKFGLGVSVCGDRKRAPVLRVWVRSYDYSFLDD